MLLHFDPYFLIWHPKVFFNQFPFWSHFTTNFPLIHNFIIKFWPLLPPSYLQPSHSQLYPYLPITPSHNTFLDPSLLFSKLIYSTNIFSFPFWYKKNPKFIYFHVSHFKHFWLCVSDRPSDFSLFFIFSLTHTLQYSPLPTWHLHSPLCPSHLPPNPFYFNPSPSFSRTFPQNLSISTNFPQHLLYIQNLFLFKVNYLLYFEIICKIHSPFHPHITTGFYTTPS